MVSTFYQNFISAKWSVDTCTRQSVSLRALITLLLFYFDSSTLNYSVCKIGIQFLLTLHHVFVYSFHPVKWLIFEHMISIKYNLHKFCGTSFTEYYSHSCIKSFENRFSTCQSSSRFKIPNWSCCSDIWL